MSVLKNFIIYILVIVLENEFVRRRLIKVVFVLLFIVSIDLFISSRIICYYIICFGFGLISINVFCVVGFFFLGMDLVISGLFRKEDII